MKIGWRGLGVAIVATACVSACGARAPSAEAAEPCSESWFRAIEEQVGTGDGQGHGPDLGSDEWKSVIEFRLGIRGRPDLPPRDDASWCRTVDRIVQERPTAGAGATPPEGPSFSCEGVAAGSIEARICADAELSALDRRLADVYGAASAKAANEHPPVLRAEQRGWVKGRDDCWKSDDVDACVREAYGRRIAELQARYRLLPATGPVAFACDGDPRNELVVTFFPTDPGTLIAERGDSVSLMFQQPSASGTRYQGRNETFWEKGGEALVTWGFEAPQMQCRKVE